MNLSDRQRALGAVQLGCDAIRGTAALVQRNHDLVAGQVFSALGAVDGVRGPARIAQAIHDGVAGVTYGSIRALSRGARRLSEQVANAASAETAESVGRAAESRPIPKWDAVEGVLNGLYGDFLASQGSSLAIPMSLRIDGRRLLLTEATLRRSYPEATSRVCLFIHGLACTESIWQAGDGGASGQQMHFGHSLTADLGYTPLYVRYNSGLPIAANGRELAVLLTDLLSVYPAPIEELVLIGHSMGGLVARCAIQQGVQAEAPWVSLLSAVVNLGTPHCGAPLARAVDVASKVLRRIPTPGTRIPAEILDLRSRGIRDLVRGRVDGDFDGRPRQDAGAGAAPMPTGTLNYALASTVTRDPHHPLGAFVGDLLVQPHSATGRCRYGGAQSGFVGSSVGGLHHFQLTTDPTMYAHIRTVLESTPNGLKNGAG